VLPLTSLEIIADERLLCSRKRKYISRNGLSPLTARTSHWVDLTTTFTAGFNVVIEHPLRALCPSHCCLALGRGLVLFIVYCFGLFASAPFSGCHPCTVVAIGCKDTMETGQVDSGFGNQSDQPGDEIQRFEYDMGRAVGTGCL
jgi:hypothetical protein